MKKNKGFTIIELMIVIVFFSFLIAILFGISSCNKSYYGTPAIEYAVRHFPECNSFDILGTTYHNPSLSEISMNCNSITKSVTIKCQIGIITDTVCYENN